MPRFNSSEERFTFTCDQRRTMKRRIAGVFNAKRGLIRFKHDDNWRQQLVQLLGDKVNPVPGKRPRRNAAHYALVRQVIDDMLDAQVIVFDEAGAHMSAEFMEKQVGLSRKLREESQRNTATYRALPRREKRQRRVAAAA